MRFVGWTENGIDELLQGVNVKRADRSEWISVLTYFHTYTSSRLWSSTEPKFELARKQIVLDMLLLALDEQPPIGQRALIAKTLSWKLQAAYYEYIKHIFEGREWVVEKQQILAWVYDHIQHQREDLLSERTGSTGAMTYNEWQTAFQVLISEFEETVTLAPTLAWKASHYTAGYSPEQAFIVLLCEQGKITYHGKSLNVDMSNRHPSIAKE